MSERNNVVIVLKPKNVKNMKEYNVVIYVDGEHKTISVTAENSERAKEIVLQSIVVLKVEESKRTNAISKIINKFAL